MNSKSTPGQRKRRGPKNADRLPYVAAAVVGGATYLYYRRDAARHRLPGPEGSGAFLAEYERIHNGIEREASLGAQTVHDAVASYYGCADFLKLAARSRENYRWALEPFRARAGKATMAAIDDAWVARLRDAMRADPFRWNRLRSCMSRIFLRWRMASGNQTVQDPWKATRGLAVKASTQNRIWPDGVLGAVLSDATPEFRALVVALLLTSQRVGDVCLMPPEAYDPEAKTLSFEQGKTGRRMLIHVPQFLAETLERMRGRRKDRLLCTPRGAAWTQGNAQETMAGMRSRLDFEQYTVHGLRATGPVALVGLGFSPSEIIALTGHRDVAGLAPYLRGVDKHAQAVPMQEALNSRFAAVLGKADEGANTRRFSGVTGRAAAKAGKVGRSSRRKAEEDAQ